MSNQCHKYDPDYKVSPGQVLEDYLDSLDIPVHVLCEKYDLPLFLIDGIIAGKNRINDDVALKLEEALGLNAIVWLNIDIDYWGNE